MKYTKRVFTQLCLKLYSVFLKVQNKSEGEPLKHLKSSGGPVCHGNGCVFLCPEFISIGSECGFGRGCRIQAITSYIDQSFSPELVIGNNVTFQDWCHIGCVEKVVIEDGTMIASRVFITDHFHGSISHDDLQSTRPAVRKLSSKPVHIGKNVWIGEGVSIMPGVTLGDNVIVGANAVVTHSFEPNTVIAGCPARVIKTI